MSELELLKNKIISCTQCILSKTRTKAVPGKGNFKADLILVGEAPGRSEDSLGEPFVGHAGQILSDALTFAGLSRDAIYITNVVKCRPPNNRIPSDEEIICCNQYLSKEIEIINPKIICILGNTAFGSLLGGKSITKNRGKIMEKEGRKYFLTIHPAAAIYNKNLFSVLKSDLKFLSKKLEEFNFEK